MKTVWCVDDDQEIITVLERMLTMLDYNTVGYLTAQKAAQSLVAGEQPDVIILDINMPNVSGFGLLEFIRRQEKWKHLAIVMLSSDSTDLQVARTLSSGADAYLFKPVMLDELETTLGTVIAKRNGGY